MSLCMRGFFVTKNYGEPKNRSWLGISFYLKALGCSCRCEFIRTQHVVRANEFAPTSMATAVFRINCLQYSPAVQPTRRRLSCHALHWTRLHSNSYFSTRIPTTPGKRG